ncbi:hypothetical protein BDR04DRAFT_1165230 [Suillus decipiens]|nr:hypothetical protein BDR04DRAFT_1165230 [Suillus decipiens]
MRRAAAEDKRQKEISAETKSRALSSDNDRSCVCCAGKGWICLWMDADRNALIKSCDPCHRDKGTCPGRPGSVKVLRAKGKKRQRTVRSPSLRGKGKRRQRSPSPDPLEVVEDDGQSLLTAVNNVLAELAWTNSLLERSILVAGGSRTAMDWMGTGLEVFLQQQREYQALLVEELQLGIRIPSDEVWTTSDVEEEDEEMNKGSGSEEDRSGGADESMEM